MNFQRINNYLGWTTFLLSATVYLLTVEPTVSFWDCGEFLASAHKLQIGHPPGAPFYMLVSRLFSMLAPNSSQVALFVNAFSALISAATVMFLFWTITLLARKIAIEPNSADTKKNVAVLGAGFIGAMAYAFTDTFWFSAVEAEVYAFSSFFTAVVFWAILKWKTVADEAFANRWLILIAYLMGLSIGVHLLNLLAIPAIVFTYYFRKHETTRKGTLTAFVIACLTLASIMWVIIPGVPALAGWFELTLVNTVGLPYHSGLIFTIVLLFGALAYGIYITRKHKNRWANMLMTCIAMILLGYSSFGVILIRANANPSMNENNPANVFNLQKYLNREQYGDRPLLYGHNFGAPVIGQKEGNVSYLAKNGKYEKTIPFPDYQFDSRFNVPFPRMYSNQRHHIRAYQEWSNMRGRPIRVSDGGGESQAIYIPTMGDNLQFFITYQLGHMYLRYFLWNFAGRQNDTQGHGGVMYGNWISGIPPIDNMRLGEEKLLPDELAHNKSRNKYYFLPLLLGLIGFFFQYGHSPESKKEWVVVSLLFLFTGIAIVVYLNQTPYQPRERDYAYAGSFYAFAIWIGLGVMALTDGFQKYLKPGHAGLAATLLALIVPGILLAENWDDHNRSDRYMARDYARNYLESCAPNAILFTYGDNDTFPLWYVQEVEGFRTDVRICNITLLGMNWYIDQMQRRTYASAPIPLSLNSEQYEMGKRDYIPIDARIKKPIKLQEAITFIASDDERSKIAMQDGSRIDFLPGKNIYLTVDKEAVLKNEVLEEEDIAQLIDTLHFTLGASSLSKSDLVILDMIAQNNWKRPIYFDLSAQKTLKLGLESYLQHEGLAYRLVPIETPSTDYRIGHINTRLLFDRMMNKFSWGNIQDTTLWIDENNVREVKILEAKLTFNRLATSLLDENRTDSALMVLNRCMETFPDQNIPYDFEDLGLAESYYLAGAFEKGNSIINRLADRTIQRINYYVTLSATLARGLDREQERQLAILSNCVNLASTYNQKEVSTKLDNELRILIERYSPNS